MRRAAGGNRGEASKMMNLDIGARQVVLGHDKLLEIDICLRMVEQSKANGKRKKGDANPA